MKVRDEKAYLLFCYFIKLFVGEQLFIDDFGTLAVLVIMHVTVLWTRTILLKGICCVHN